MSQRKLKGKAAEAVVEEVAIVEGPVVQTAGTTAKAMHLGSLPAVPEVVVNPPAYLLAKPVATRHRRLQEVPMDVQHVQLIVTMVVLLVQVVVREAVVEVVAAQHVYRDARGRVIINAGLDAPEVRFK